MRSYSDHEEDQLRRSSCLRIGMSFELTFGAQESAMHG